jgi:hypothetical protein
MTMYFRRHTWKVEVYTEDLYKGVTSSIYVLVSTKVKHSASGTSICIEILDKNWEHTVFHTERPLGDDSWLRVFPVERERLESSCVDNNDNVPVRCTLTFIDLIRSRRGSSRRRLG